jgi:hypothetical protein
MRDGGKGDMQRPLGVPMEQFDNAWDRIFNKKANKKLTAEEQMQIDNLAERIHEKECGK